MIGMTIQYVGIQIDLNHHHHHIHPNRNCNHSNRKLQNKSFVNIVELIIFSLLYVPILQ